MFSTMGTNLVRNVPNKQADLANYLTYSYSITCSKIGLSIFDSHGDFDETF